jgi:hypothetical protein
MKGLPRFNCGWYTKFKNLSEMESRRDLALIILFITKQKQKNPLQAVGFFDNVAEEERFELSESYKPSLVFKTSAFSRSATPPERGAY